ncbi:MAG TPA: tetratricopeptide repeat protein [Bacteroidales bacterium]|nr:tetratricopeptide repeat protein [Bacteroidales bacterium]
MKRYFIYALLITLALVGFSCSKKAAPSTSSVADTPKVDVAAFDRFYVEGLRQKLMGNAGEALKYFEQCLKNNPQSDAVYYQMAQVIAGTGDMNTAKKYALKAVKFDEKNLWYLMMLSQLYYQTKNVDSAIVWYEKAVRNFPDNENIQLTLGNLYVENGNYEKANSIFESFDKKYGVNDASTLSSVRILMSLGKYDDARLKIEELLKEKPEDIVYNGLLAEIYSGKGDKEKALQIYEKLFKISPDDPQVQLSYSEFLAGEKKYDELFSILNSIAINGEIRKEDKIRLFAELAQNSDLVADRENRMTKSLMVLEAAYADDDIIPLIRTDLLVKQGKNAAASARLEELIKLKPGNYFAWEKLLFTYLDMGDFEKLRIRGEECASRFNMSFIAKVLYANGAIETGKYDTALEELKKADILAGDNKAYKMQVLTMRADVFYRTGVYEKAFETFEEALKINNDDVTMLNNYAYYLAEQDTRLKEAEDLARKVVETEKNNNTFLDTYGWVLYKRGKLNEAAKVFETIISSGEKPDAEWFEHYGYILKKQRKCGKAVESWKRAVELDPRKTNLNKEIENCEK